MEFRGFARRDGGQIGLMVVIVGVLAAGIGGEAVATTSIDSPDDLAELCELGAPDIDTDDAPERSSYHQHRREAIHGVYEVTLPELDDELMEYDRVSGLLTISGFGALRPYRSGPAIRFRNEAMPGFEVSEQTAHDLMAQLRMGTVQVQLGFALAARGDYDLQFCPETSTESAARQLLGDLLYVSLVDRERSQADGGEIIGIYRTQQGHRRALTRQIGFGVDAETLPDVQVSHIQWRRQGACWSEDVDTTADLEAINSRLVTAIENALYPCYLQVLARNASLQGAVVVEIPVDDDSADDTAFLMDTMQINPMRRCIRDRLEGLDELDALEQTENVDAVDAFKATVLMRRR